MVVLGFFSLNLSFTVKGRRGRSVISPVYHLEKERKFPDLKISQNVMKSCAVSAGKQYGPRACSPP